MNKQDYYTILAALLSCKTKNDYESHRFYVTKHQSYSEQDITTAINTMSRIKPKN